MLCGNGGSSADRDHIVGELMKSFVLKSEIPLDDRLRLKNFFDDWEYLSIHLQKGIPTVSLPSQTAINTAFINDVAADMVYAQGVYGLGTEKDV